MAQVMGMDVPAVLAAASRLEAEARHLAALRAHVEHLVETAVAAWHGPDARRYRHRWHQDVRPTLDLVIESVRQLAEQLRLAARAQMEASKAGPPIAPPPPVVSSSGGGSAGVGSVGAGIVSTPVPVPETGHESHGMGVAGAAAAATGVAAALSGIPGAGALAAAAKLSGAGTDAVASVAHPNAQSDVPEFTNAQKMRALEIIAEIKKRRLPKRAAYIAFATVFQESNFHMYANANNPESLRLPHDAVGSDHGSVGLFQQQVGGAANSTANWGTTAELMDVQKSTDRFLDAMLRKNWQHDPIGSVCQQVQGSAFPDAYNNQVEKAQRIVDQLW